MPQLNTVVLKDAAGASHNFAPRAIDSGVASLVESTGIPIGDRRVTISQTSTTQGRRKVTFKVAIPVVQDTVQNGVSRPVVVRTAYADVTLAFDGTSSATERSDIMAYLATMFASTQTLIKGVVVDLEGVY